MGLRTIERKESVRKDIREEKERSQGAGDGGGAVFGSRSRSPGKLNL